MKIVTKLNNFVAFFLTLIILDVKHENIRENNQVFFLYIQKFWMTRKNLEIFFVASKIIDVRNKAYHKNGELDLFDP